MDAFIGIDVAVAKKKYCPISICIKDKDVLRPLLLADEPMQPPKGLGNIATLTHVNNIAYASAIKDYIVAVCERHNLKPTRIAIDSPLQPRAPGLKRRLAEQALDKLCMSCYTTPSELDFENISVKAKAHIANCGQANKLPHSMQIFMLAGFVIADALKTVAPCIEIYPHATAKLLGVAGKHKMKDDQAFVQLSAISKYTGWPNSENEWKQVSKICKGPTHDKIDAYSAAWLASLPAHNRQPLGEPDKEDVIWIPRLEQLAVHDISNKREIRIVVPITRGSEVKSIRVGNAIKNSNNVDEHRRLCPACKDYWFKRLSFGWDAHAAYKCTGLADKNPEVRKKQFKAKFL